MAITVPANAGNYHGLPAEVESVSNVTLTNSVDLGTVRIFGGEEYLYVYNDGGGASIPVGYACVIASGNSGYSVSVSGNTFFNAPMGFVKHTTLTTAQYGWVLTRGFTQVKMHANSSGILGDPILVEGNGTAYGCSVVNTATTAFSQITSLFGLVPCGQIVGNATASAGTSLAYVRCFGS